jgi:hypothetical protein
MLKSRRSLAAFGLAVSAITSLAFASPQPREALPNATMATAPEAIERDVAKNVYDFWKLLATQQGYASLLTDKRGVVAACIPWNRVQRLPDGMAVFIDHWWQESKRSVSKSRSLVLDKCERWRSTSASPCSCSVISEHLEPMLQVPSEQMVALREKPETQDERPVSAPSDAQLSAERQVPLLKDLSELRQRQGMQGTPYYFGIGNTMSLAPDPAPPAATPRLVDGRGHNQQIFQARWSPDGKLIASAGSDHRVLVWRAPDMILVAELRGHAGIVDALAFSADGKMLASGAQDGTIILWDLGSGRRVDTITARRGWVNSLTWTPEGRLFASYSDGNSVVQWHKSAEPGAAWSATDIPAPIPAGGRVDWHSRMNIAGADDEALYDVLRQKWRVPGPAWRDLAGVFGPLEGQMAGHAASKFEGGGSRFSDKGGQLQISRDGGTSMFRRLDAYKEGTISALTFSPDGKLVASAGEYGTFAEVADREKGRIEIWRDGSDIPITMDGSSILAFSADSRLLLGGYRSNEGLRVWNASTGHIVGQTEPGSPGFSAITISPDASHMAIARDDGEIHLWNLLNGRLDHVLRGHPGTIGKLQFDASGQRLAASGSLERYLTVWDARSGKLIWALAPQDDRHLTGITDMSFSVDGSTIEYTDARGAQMVVFARRSATGELAYRRTGPVQLGPGGEHLLVEGLSPGQSGQNGHGGPADKRFNFRFRQADGRSLNLLRPAAATTEVEATAYSPGGHFVAVLRRVVTENPEDFGATNLTVWDTRSGVLQLDDRLDGMHTIAIANDGSILGGFDDGRVMLWSKPSRDPSNPRGWTSAELTRSSSSVRNVAASGSGLLAALGDDGLVRLWPDVGNKDAITIRSESEAKWLVTRADGRFDAANPDNLSGFNWVMPDDPFRPLSPTLFMRDFFEPGLLVRALHCAQSVTRAPADCDDVRVRRSLVELNRVPPAIKIMSIVPSRSSTQAIVTVSASPGEDQTERNRKTVTDAYDLRLFRDGQLVGRWTRLPDVEANARDQNAWRAATRVSGTHRFLVNLPAARAGQTVRFTAYAFNEDRVKSANVEAEYRVPARIARVRPRAYVVAIGVNRYATSRGKLNYAVEDAKAIASGLSAIRSYDVVTIPLLADGHVANASREKIAAVFGALNGSGADSRRLAGIPHAEQLRRVGPDDIVVISFSGHGYTDAVHNFHLVPADVNLDRPLAEQTSLLISSDDLSTWLEKIDASQIVLIIDACYSAQSVESDGFRAGPMGDPGFGQLAYDKGIRILAATQSDDVALELGALQHGLLTYALVEEGLGRDGCGPKAEQTPSGIPIDALLRYAEKRTPLLYDDARDGRLHICRGTAIRSQALLKRNAGPDATIAPLVRTGQTPVLFDFSKAARPVYIQPQAPIQTGQSTR